MERRRSQRIYEPFAVRISGVDQSGEKFKVDTVLDNLSSTGMYVRLRRKVSLGSRLAVMVQMSTAASDAAQIPRISANGVVRRIEPLDGGATGTAIEFRQHRFV